MSSRNRNILLGVVLVAGVFILLFFGVRIYDSFSAEKEAVKLTPVPTRALVDNRGELPPPTEAVKVPTSKPDGEKAPDEGNVAVDITGEPEAVVTEMPQATPTDVPVYGKLDPFIDAKEIQELAMECCFGYYRNEHYSLLGEDIRLTPEGVKGLMIDKYHADKACAEIPLSMVTPGDLCVTDDCVGFCFTSDPEGHPIFVYFVRDDEKVDTLFHQFHKADYGVFFGYIMSDKDELFFGSVPLNGAKFYDTGHGAGYPNGMFKNKSIYEDVYRYGMSLNFESYDSAVYKLGRALCYKDKEYVKSVLATADLDRKQIQENENTFMALCDDFLKQVGAEQYREYTIIPGAGASTRIMYNDYFYFKGQVLSLDPDTYLQTSGSFEFTLVCNNDDNKMTFLPYAIREIKE